MELNLIDSILPSGPLSCLCSEVEECENTGDNEVDFLTNVFQVKSIYVERQILHISIFRRKTVRNFVPLTLSAATTLGIDTMYMIMS